MDPITLSSTQHSSDLQYALSTGDEAEATRSPVIVGWGLTEHCNLACLSPITKKQRELII